VCVLSLVDATRAATATHTVNGTSFAREGHRCVPGAVVRSSADVSLRCLGATTSSTLSAHSVDNRCTAARSASSRAGRTVVRALYDSVADEKLPEKFLTLIFSKMFVQCFGTVCWEGQIPAAEIPKGSP